MERIGPLDIVGIGFPRNRFGGEILAAPQAVVDRVDVQDAVRKANGQLLLHESVLPGVAAAVTEADAAAVRAGA